MGHQFNVTGVVTEYAPPREIGFRTTSGPIHGDLHLDLQAEGTGTKVTLAASITPVGVLKLAEPLIARESEKVWGEDLEQLKGYLESRP